MGVTVSSSHVVSAALSSSGVRFLTLFPCSSVRSLSRKTVLHKLLQRESFPGCSSSWTVPACVLPMGCSPSGTGCSSMGPPQGHKPWQQTCSGMGFSFHGSTGPGRILLQHGLPTGSQPPSGIHLLWCGVPSTGYKWISAPPWTSMGCRGTTCFTMVFMKNCKGRLSALTSRAPLPPSFFIDLGVCKVVSLTQSHSSLFAAVAPQVFFFPFLNMLSQRRYHHFWVAWPWPAVGPS